MKNVFNSESESLTKLFSLTPFLSFLQGVLFFPRDKYSCRRGTPFPSSSPATKWSPHGSQDIRKLGVTRLGTNSISGSPSAKHFVRSSASSGGWAGSPGSAAQTCHTLYNHTGPLQKQDSSRNCAMWLGETTRAEPGLKCHSSPRCPWPFADGLK